MEESGLEEGLPGQGGDCGQACCKCFAIGMRGQSSKS